MTAIARHRTAMSRSMLSRPLQHAHADGLLDDGVAVFDYGCGRGDDVRTLNGVGIRAQGWDPAHAPSAERRRAEVVNLGYVINVIEDRTERAEVLRSAWTLATSVLVVSARLVWDPDASSGKPFGDGRLTGNGTFQKYYEHDELKAWVESVLGVSAITAAPGVLYVFRDASGSQRLLARHTRDTGRPRQGIAELLFEQRRDLLEPVETFVATHRRLPGPADLGDIAEVVTAFGSIRSAFSVIKRVTGPAKWADIDLGSRRTSERMFTEHLDDLQPLLDFVTDRGRLPRDGEFEGEAAVVEHFGSVRAAFSVVRRVTGPEKWERATGFARDNFLVYTALTAFGGRPKFSELPEDLQYDAKELYGSYNVACQEADRLLRSIADLNAIGAACQSAPFGKLTPEALYVHVAYVGELPPLLRVYQGAARMLTGDVDETTLVKLNRIKPQVSFLEYDDFEKEPHPALRSSIVAKLGAIRVKYRDFSGGDNRPILHRKELFVPDFHPTRAKFEKLTLQEEAAGLLDRPDIGTELGWRRVLTEAGRELKGHRLTSTGS
jgi:hypothetical protein